MSDFVLSNVGDAANANTKIVAGESDDSTKKDFEHFMSNGVCVCFPTYSDTSMKKENLNSAIIQIKDNVKNLKGDVKTGSFKVKKNTDGKWELDESDNDNKSVYDSFVGKEPTEEMSGGSGKYIRQTKSKKSKRRKGGRSKRRPLR